MPFTFQPMPHTEARDRTAKLPPVTREVMDGMLPEMRAYAFTITGLDVGDQMSKIRDQIAAVPAGAKTWDKAKKEIAAELDEALGGKESRRRAEILLRTHVFRGYAAARYRSLMAQKDVFPFWQYKTHGDGNVRPSHAALGGKIFPAGHEIWQRIFPPWDWGCRCLVVPLTGGAVKRMQEAGMAAPVNDGSLLPTQIQKPEAFTAKESDIIATAQKLPDGTPLNHAPTWASAPWSVPGNIQHDWPLIRARYAHDPEALAAFEKWARKQMMTGQKKSVWTWVNGRAKPVKKAKPADLPAPEPEKAGAGLFPKDPATLKPVKKLGGSTGAMLMEDAEGNRWVLKKGASAEHLREEALADDLYRQLGVPVPEALLYETAAGPVKLARFIEGRSLADVLAKATPDERKGLLEKLGEHFHWDALMGNWDVVGLARDNILVDAAGLPWRIDNGGSLRFRAMGTPKGDDWNEIPDELFTLRNAAKNPQTAEIFGGLRLPAIARKIEGMDITKLTAPAEVKAMLDARWKNMSDVATKALDMEHDGWRDSYGESLCGHILGLRKAGITADLPKELSQAVGDVMVRDENGKLWDDLRASKSAAAATAPADGYWPNILGAVKTLNNHAAKGSFGFNQSTVDAALKHKAALEKLAKGKGDDSMMAKHYLGQLAHIEAGVAQSKAKQAFALPQLNAWSPPAKAPAKVRKAGSLVERLRDYVTANGGDYQAVSAWKKAQAGDSWNPDAQAKKVWVAKHLNIPSKKVYWQGMKQTTTAEAHFKALEKRLGSDKVDAAFTIHHAFVQELLANSELRHSDRAARALRIIRTENKSLVPAYGLKAGQPANCPRGLCESGSAFRTTTVFGSEVTIQAVPHSRVLGSYIMEKNPGVGDPGFLGDGENEWSFVAADQPFLYQGSAAKVTVDLDAGNTASAWGVPTQHLRTHP